MYRIRSSLSRKQGFHLSADVVGSCPCALRRGSNHQFLENPTGLALLRRKRHQNYADPPLLGRSSRHIPQRYLSRSSMGTTLSTLPSPVVSKAMESGSLLIVVSRSCPGVRRVKQRSRIACASSESSIVAEPVKMS